MANRFEAQGELKEKLVCVNRVSKTVKGGRIARFAAIMIVQIVPDKKKNKE